jgi:hypothetical protein
MATIALSAIGAIDYLGDRTILTRVMFCSVVAGKKILMFFPARKSIDDRREVVTAILACNATVRQEGCDDHSAESWFQ